MKMSYTSFQGLRPAVDSRLIGKSEAIKAVDCDLRFKTIRPFLAPDVTTIDADHVPLGYLAAGTAEDGDPIAHLHDTLHHRGIARKSAGSAALLTQDMGLVVGVSYEVTFYIRRWVAGTVAPRIGSTVGTARSAEGVFTETLVCSGDTLFSFDADEDFDGDMDAVSVKRDTTVELVTNGAFDADTDWTKGTGWTIGSGVASKAAGVASNLDQTLLLTLGNSYEVTYTISNYSAGSVTPYVGSTSAGTARMADGTFVETIINATDAVFSFNADDLFVGDIDDVSVKEVTTPLEMATNRLFTTQTDWTEGTGWELLTGIEDGLYEVYERGTCIAPSVVSRDVHERVYFTRPEGGMWARGNTNGENGYTEDLVGVRAPDGITEYLSNPSAAPRSSGGGDPMACVPKWYWRVEHNSTFAVAAEGEFSVSEAAFIVATTDVDSQGRPVYKYEYQRAFNGGDHVAPNGTYNRSTYNFIMYAELLSQGGRFLGTIYPEPSSLAPSTDVFIGGTLLEGITYQGVNPSLLFEYTTFRADPAGTEYSHYRSYVFTYVTARGEESAPSPATAPLAVFPTDKVTLNFTLPAISRPAEAVSVRIYRTETTEAGTAFFYVDEFDLDGGDSFSYVDFILPVDLPGDTLVSLKWAPPPVDLKGLVLSTKGFYAGFTGGRVWLSEPFLAFAWPTDYAVDFAGTVKHIARYGDTLAVFSDREIALLVGNTPLELRKIKVEGFENLTSIYSTVEVDGLLYFATSSGVAAVSGTNVAVVTKELVSEQWWRTYINSQEVRIVSFDGALYVLSEPGGVLYRIGLADEGGLVQLSDADVVDIYSSSSYDGVIVLINPDEGEYDEYLLNEGEEGNRTVIWRGRTEIADTPMAIISVRILASSYTPNITFRAYNESGVQLTVTNISSDVVRKLPVMRRGREWSFEVEGSTDIVSIEIGTSGRVR